jgi:hypothetical protein
MKTDGSDWKDKIKDKSESEQLFDSLLFFRQVASISVERLRIIKELERLLLEDRVKFEEYLSDIIGLYENECEPVLNVTEDDPVPDELQDLYFDKNTTLAQYLYSKRIFILAYLLELKTLWNKGQTEEVTAKLKEAHHQDISQVFNSKKRIEDEFPVLENMTMAAIQISSDNQKNEILKKSLEEMRNDFRNNGFKV